MSDHLQRIYYDAKHPAGYSSIQKLSKASGISRKKVYEWMKSQPTYTLHRPARLHYPVRSYIVHDIDEQWQADLADMIRIKRYNGGHQYILTVIDIFSRYAWARPLKTKRGEEVAKAFKSIFDEGRIPQRIQTDQGKEFENRQVRSLFSQHDIELFSIKSQFKAAMVERFNRTLKTKIWKYFTKTLKLRWIDVLQDMVSSYNQSIHRMIKRKPADITPANAHEIRQVHRRTGSKESDIKVGDKVRISKAKNVFEKGYLPNWTEEIFTVHSINTKHYPIQYKLKDYDGDVIDGSFYRYEIQPITLDDDTFLVEKVIRRQRRDGVEWLYVKWLGYPASMNSWVRRSDILQVTNR